MKNQVFSHFFIIVLFCLNTSFADTIQPLQLLQKVPLKTVTGRIDHMSIDVKGNRLFIAALEHNSLEVIDLSAQKDIYTIPHLHEPQGVLFISDNDTLVVANEGTGSCQIYDGSSLQFLKKIHVGEDADNLRKKVVEVWKLDGTKDNFPMALDEENHRLFIGCRSPAQMLVIDTNAGALKVKLAICDDVDDLFYDSRSKKIYASCGSGIVQVIHQVDVDSYETIAKITTSPGARTSLLVEEQNRFYLAVPEKDKEPAAIWIYQL